MSQRLSAAPEDQMAFVERVSAIPVTAVALREIEQLASE